MVCGAKNPETQRLVEEDDEKSGSGMAEWSLVRRTPSFPKVAAEAVLMRIRFAVWDEARPFQSFHPCAVFDRLAGDRVKATASA